MNQQQSTNGGHFNIYRSKRFIVRREKTRWTFALRAWTVRQFRNTQYISQYLSFTNAEPDENNDRCWPWISSLIPCRTRRSSTCCCFCFWCSMSCSFFEVRHGSSKV
ncbi:uncharacterized protein LOC124432281 [Vespa crabro]|uniref:uncharacterized protein LOC124432281 n=1 Tax=Vespa crabro TaxID=7445 RepID=UPI001F022EC8|nr:uncharacterized protein LOC124432281 [Vespa crabro]